MRLDGERFRKIRPRLLPHGYDAPHASKHGRPGSAALMTQEERKRFVLFLALAAMGLVVLWMQASLGALEDPGAAILAPVLLIGGGIVGAAVTWVRAGDNA